MNVRPAEPLAHDGGHLQPQELWTAWNTDALIVIGLLALAWTYLRGRGRTPARGTARWRPYWFWVGLLALAVALLSPLDALSDELASAHMVQHLLLTLVTAPLLVLSAPSARLLRGSPSVVRHAFGAWRRRLRLVALARVLRHPGAAWLLHVGVFWAWHSAALYGAALERPGVHVVEHATFLVTGVLFWRTVVGVRVARVPPGLGVLLLFGMAMSSALLSVLLTFGRSPWYSGYATTTRNWGLEPLADQQLAGAIMWVPAGLVHIAAALTLLVTWLRSTQDGEHRPGAVSGGRPLPVRSDPGRPPAPRRRTRSAGAER
jgi:putative membrane protein